MTAQHYLASHFPLQEIKNTMHNIELNLFLLDKERDKETSLEQHKRFLAVVFPPQFNNIPLIIIQLRNTL